MAVETRVSAFQTAQRRFDAAADVIGLSDDARRGLRDVKRELTVHFPVRMDDGSVRVFTGWRVQPNISRGAAKGGIRYHPDINLDLVKAPAMLTTRKCAAVCLAYRAAQGARGLGVRTCGRGSPDRRGEGLRPGGPVYRSLARGGRVESRRGERFSRRCVQPKRP